MIVDISARDEEKVEQISQISQLTILSQQQLPIITFSKTKTLLGVLMWSCIMLVVTIIAFQTKLGNQLAGKFSQYYPKNEFVNRTCDPEGQFTNNSGNNNRLLNFRALYSDQSFEDDEQVIYQQEYQQQQTQYQANQTSNSTFNQNQSDEYYHQYNNTNTTFEQFALCYASLTQVGVYLQYQFAYDKINALFYVAIGVSLVTFAGFLHIKNSILNTISSLLFVLFHSLLVAGVTLIYQSVNGGLKPVIAVCLLILINLILIITMDMRKCTQKTQLTTIFIITPIILFAEGPLKFEIESIPIALLFSTFIISMKDLNLKSSIKVFGLIWYLLFKAFSKVFIVPISKIRELALREHRLQKTTDDNKIIHLTKGYMNILGVLILMYVIWILTYNTQFINLFVNQKLYTFFVYSTKTPMMIACYIIPSALHLISTMIYQNTRLTKAKYAFIYILVIIEWIFLALLIGALTTIEITQNIFVMDNKSIEYFLVLSMIGVIGLISTVDLKFFQYQQILIPISSINMIAYYFDYRSICIGLASSLVFCYYIITYSEFLISEQNRTMEIALEDDFITTNYLINPIQLLSHLIQSIINRYKFKEVLGYTQTHNVDHDKIKVQKAEIELIQQ